MGYHPSSDGGSSYDTDGEIHSDFEIVEALIADKFMYLSTNGRVIYFESVSLDEKGRFVLKEKGHKVKKE